MTAVEEIIAVLVASRFAAAPEASLQGAIALALGEAGIEFERWRFNLRASNTEPLIRLNVESRGDAALMQEKTREVLKALELEG